MTTAVTAFADEKAKKAAEKKAAEVLRKENAAKEAAAKAERAEADAVAARKRDTSNAQKAIKALEAEIKEADG